MPSDPLAALLHAEMVGCRYDEVRDQYEPDFAACVDHTSDARILASRGLTFSAPPSDPADSLDIDGKPFCPTGSAQRYHAIGECECSHDPAAPLDPDTLLCGCGDRLLPADLEGHLLSEGRTAHDPAHCPLRLALEAIANLGTRDDWPQTAAEAIGIARAALPPNAATPAPEEADR